MWEESILEHSEKVNNKKFIKYKERKVREKGTDDILV